TRTPRSVRRTIIHSMVARDVNLRAHLVILAPAGRPPRVQSWTVSVPSPQPSTRLSVRQHAVVLAAFALLVAAFTYPLILAPGDLLPDHKDPMMYGWAMVSNVRRLLSTPLAVFHGNAFYPHGNVMAYTDLVLTPTLTAGPIYLLTGNPVLQYNLTLLSW